MSEPDWLVWAREIQAIAQSGLTFTRDPYDRERYAQLRALSARMMAAHCATPAARIEALFAEQQGYATPKIDVRAAAFQGDRILMVREVADGHRWTLPGGWADVNLTPAENVVKEVFEESGFTAVATRPARYSPTVSGEAKKLRKLRDQTSSKKAIVTPCITRVRKSHSSTAPSRAGRKLKPACATPSR